MDNFSIHTGSDSENSEIPMLDNIANGVSIATRSVAKAVGHVFNHLAALKDNVSSLSELLHTGQGVMSAVRYGYEVNGSELSAQGFDKSLSKSLFVIDLTRIFSDAYYFFSGDFIDDLKNWNLGAALSNVSFSCADGISTFLGISDILKTNLDIETVSEETAELLDDISTYFVIGGFVGGIVESVRTLIKEEGKDVNAWLDLASSVVAVSLPILALSGVTLVPLIVALGLISSVLSLSSSVYSHYKKPAGAPGVNFADNTLGLGTALTPVGAIAALVKDQEGFEPLGAIAAEIGPLGELSGALSVMNKGKELFHTNKDGLHLWEYGSVWEIGSNLTGLAASSMSMAGWIASAGAFSDAFKKNRIFKFVKDILNGSSSSLVCIDSSIKLHKMNAEYELRAHKQHKWEVLSSALQAGHPAASTTQAWVAMQDRLITDYDFKIMSERARNGDSSFTNVKIERWKNYFRAINNSDLAGYFRQKKANLVTELNTAVQAEGTSPEAAALLTVQRDALRVSTNAMMVVGYRKALADYKFNDISINVRGASWKVAQNVFKTASAIASIASLFFASYLGVAPMVVSMLTSLVSFGKYFSDASVKREKMPEMRFAAAAA